MIENLNLGNTEHIEALYELFTQQAEHHNACGRGLYETPWDASDIAKAYENLIASVKEEKRSVILYRDERYADICGMCAYRTFSEWIDGIKVAFVDELVIARDARGHGCGKHFLDELEQTLASQGYDGFQLSCYTTNKSAMAFYEAMGFSAVGVEYEKKFRQLHLAGS